MNNEPALIVAFVTAGIDVAIAFGAPIDQSQKAAVIGLVSAGLAVIGGFVVRQNVFPLGHRNAGH